MAIKKIEDNTSKDSPYDICIIGSGPAGLTLASELVGSNKKVCVLECGHVEKTNYVDSLKEVENHGDIFIKLSSRERIYGGTSTVWSGLSSPMDDIDFSSWPIKLKDLEKYYKKAHKYGFAKFEDFYEKLKQGNLRIDSSILEEKVFIASDPPWDFGKKLRYIFDEPNMDLYLDVTVTDLASNKKDNGKINIENINVITSKGYKEKIYANTFVLTTGGIESVRLLLLSKDTSSNGLGNENDNVGRYIMNHPKGNFGSIKLNKPIKDSPNFFGYLHDGYAKYSGLRINENLQKSLNIMNSYIRLEPIFPWTDTRGVSSFIGLIKRARTFLDWWKRRQKKIVNLRDWNETGDDKNVIVYNKKSNLLKEINIILCDIKPVFNYILHRLFSKKEISTKTIRLRNFMEMEPRKENRLVLGKKLDKNGKPLPQITLNISELDKKSLIELHKILGEEIKRNNIGILESSLEKVKEWPIKAEASHHIGGAIMGNSPETSVVDRNLKIHSVNNLYICSSAVFPTSGCANPTYTICALAIRLAEKLNI